MVKLGNRGGFKITLGGIWSLSDKMSLMIEPFFHSYAFGQSNVGTMTFTDKIPATFVEPASSTYKAGATVALTFQL